MQDVSGPRRVVEASWCDDAEVAVTAWGTYTLVGRVSILSLPLIMGVMLAFVGGGFCGMEGARTGGISVASVTIGCPICPWPTFDTDVVPASCLHVCLV